MNYQNLRDRFKADAVLEVHKSVMDALKNPKKRVSSLFPEPILVEQIEGHIQADLAGRFNDGEYVYTSPVFQITQVDCEEIFCVRTRNTKYIVVKA